MAQKKESVNTEKITTEKVINSWNNLFNSGNSMQSFVALQQAYTSNPYIQNQRMKEINSTGINFNRKKIEEMISHPASSEQALRSEAQNSLMIYPLLKLYYLYTDMLTYREYITPKYVSEKKMKQMSFLEEHDFVHTLKDKLQGKRTFRNIVLDTMIEGKTAYAVRLGYRNFDYYHNAKLPKIEYFELQKIPSDYWKITGMNSDSKFTISVDFTLFWKPGFSIYQYPPIFQTYFEIFNGIYDENTKKLLIDPSKPPAGVTIEMNSNGTWYYWQEMPPSEVFVFSHNETNVLQIPNFAGLFLQAEDLQSYSLLQEELLQLPLSSVIIGTIPYLNPNSKSGVATNNFSMSTEAVAFFQNLFNSVAPSGVQLFMAPGEDWKHFDFQDTIPNGVKIYDSAMQQFISSAGTNGLMSTSEKPSMAMVKAAQAIEPRYANRLYDQFEKMFDVILERKFNLSTTWKYHIEGDVFSDSETFARCEKALTLGQTDVLPQYSSFFGQDMVDKISRQRYVQAIDIYKGFQLLPNSYITSSNKDPNLTGSEGGRPVNENPDSDNTAASQESMSNTERIVSMENITDRIEELIEEYQ